MHVTVYAIGFKRVGKLCCKQAACQNAFHFGMQSILEAGMADMEAARERDPACDKYTQCILYFKGFQAIQCQRIAHWLWKKDRKVPHLACLQLLGASQYLQT